VPDAAHKVHDILDAVRAGGCDLLRDKGTAVLPPGFVEAPSRRRPQSDPVAPRLQKSQRFEHLGNAGLETPVVPVQQFRVGGNFPQEIIRVAHKVRHNRPDHSCIGQDLSHGLVHLPEKREARKPMGSGLLLHAGRKEIPACAGRVRLHTVLATARNNVFRRHKLNIRKATVATEDLLHDRFRILPGLRMVVAEILTAVFPVCGNRGALGMGPGIRDGVAAGAEFGSQSEATAPSVVQEFLEEFLFYVGMVKFYGLRKCRAGVGQLMPVHQEEERVRSQRVDEKIHALLPGLQRPAAGPLRCVG